MEEELFVHLSLCYLLVLQGVCGSLPPEMCSAWYGGG